MFIKLKIIAIFLLFFFSNITYASFDWGGSGGNCSGSGNFQQQIKSNEVVEVGDIPSGKEGVKITLTSNEDVDIQLYDKLTGDKIIAWPDGFLAGHNKQAMNYKGMNIEWSGYHGDGANYGHEYIHITGITNRTFVMKAFGYQAGYAQVDYLWTGTEGCSEGGSNSASGSGTFQQQILEQAVVTVGDIPTGIKNLSVQLISDRDVDIQLYDKDSGTALVAWPNGLLSGSDKQSTTYKGMSIEWSGYNGDGTNLGHEYITITGITSTNLTMKAFGYQAGYATVNYSWGNSVALACNAPEYKGIFINKLPNPSCEDRWRFHIFYKLGFKFLNNEIARISDQIDLAKGLHTEVDNIAKMADRMVSFAQVGSDFMPVNKFVGILTVQTQGAKFIVSTIPDDNNMSSVYAKEFTNVILSMIEEAAKYNMDLGSPSVKATAISQLPAVVGILNNIYGSFSLDNLAEEMVAVTISMRYLELYYAYGGVSGKVSEHYGLPYNTSFKDTIEVLAQSIGYSNTIYSKDYNVERVEEIVNHVNDKFINKLLSACIEGSCLGLNTQ